MQCPKCKNEKTGVIDTRRWLRVISRVHHCKKCDHIFSSKEYPDKQFSHSGYERRSRNNEKDRELFDDDNGK